MRNSRRAPFTWAALRMAGKASAHAEGLCVGGAVATPRSLSH